MDLMTSILYGLIQGVTEFLPVSSSGHLALLPRFLEIADPGVLFDLAMHVGTALSIVIYFHREIKKIGSDLLAMAKNPQSFRERGAWVFNMGLATAVSFIFVLLLKNFSQEYARAPIWIGVNLIIFGLLMFAADFLGPSSADQKMKHLDFKRACLIGLSQALAIFPGVSRSGATLTMSRFLGLNRDEATRFSFLLSLPIILAGFFYKLPSLLNGEAQFNWGACLVGMGVSFIVGMATIHFFLKMIKKVGLWVFTVYRILLALVVLTYL